MKTYFLSAYILCLVVMMNLGVGYGVQGITVGERVSAAVSGDEYCGKYVNGVIQNPCDIDKAKLAIRTLIMSIIIPLGSAIMVCFIVFRLLMAQKALMEGNAGAYKEAGKKIWNALLGFFVVVAVVAGLYLSVLKFLGVKGDFLNILAALPGLLIPHAYGAEPTGGLANPLIINDLYDFILLLVRLFIRFFVYPGLVAVWVWTGFAFVMAQGAPEPLMKAKKWLTWAVICTVLIFMTEAFLFALRGTINQIVPTTTQEPVYQPPAGTIGASCNVGGVYGMTDKTGACVPSRGSTGGTTLPAGANACAGKLALTECQGSFGTGLCGVNAQGVLSCYSAKVGDKCIPPGSQIVIGEIGPNYHCEVSAARNLIGKGGSCQVSAQCSSGSCVSNICQ